jgi:hypothetical protein
MRKILYALTFVALLTAGTWAQQSGGAFIPSFNYTIPGNWTFSGANTVTGTMVRASYTTQINNRAKVGTTAGWVVGAATNLPYVATMAASQTAGTLVIPVSGLHVGDTITGVRIVAQVESAGGAVTIDAALRAVTNVAAEPTDAAITNGGITQVAVSADTAVSAAVTGIAEVVTSGKTYYILVTATTAASTDIILQAAEITVTQS